MRDTVDLGIDLGTTNSAIALAGQDGATVLKNNDGRDTTPSAVWCPRPGVVYVGAAARDRCAGDPDNTAAEFKQEMGLADARRRFARAGVALSPQQLSAEVLKALRADATHRCGGAPDAAVITVPAAFTLNQNQATTEAAMLAGFTAACPLVQEPTAAAFAYGFHDAAERGYWMVFDFGGGTFDAAVVAKRDGDLRVLDHAGDPYLGGRLIDWALVDRLLAPAAASELGLSGFTRDNPAWRADFGKLKAATERARVELSRRETVDVLAELDTGSGTETFGYQLRRADLDAVAEPFYARAVNLCRAALRDASLEPGDIDRLLLVGGVTQAPGLRARLADPDEGLGIALDTSLDPSTVVARGAAIFASTVRRPRTPSLGPAPGEFGVELVYDPSVTTTTPTVAGRLTSWAPVDWTDYTVTLANPDGRPAYVSPRIAVTADGAFLAEVDIDEHRVSTLHLTLADPHGTACPVTPSTVTFTHRDVEFGGVRLAQTLGIQLADHGFARLLRKGDTLPAHATEVFTTSSALHRADTGAVLRIPVVQGERARGDRNREVGMLEIRPRDVHLDLPAGSDVEVTFEVDASSLVTVTADVPMVDAVFEAEIALGDVRTSAPEQLRARLDEAEHRLSVLRAASGASPDARDRLARLDQEGAVAAARDLVAASATDAGAAGAAEDRIRDLHADLDDVAEAAGLPELVAELRELVYEATALAEEVGSDADRAELAAVAHRAGDAVTANDSAAVRAQIERATRFVVDLERRRPDFPRRVFTSLRAMVGPSADADALLRDGERALRDADDAALSRVNDQLIRLLPKEEQDSVVGVVRRP